MNFDRIHRTHQNNNSEAATHYGIRSSVFLFVSDNEDCLLKPTWLQRLASATLPGTSHPLTPSWHNHACGCGEVNDFECAQQSDYFRNCWSVGDVVWKKHKRRHPVSPRSESKCVTDASFMPTVYLSVLADHAHPFVTTLHRLPLATFTRWFMAYLKRWIISKSFLEHSTSVYYTRYPQPNIAPTGWVGTGDSNHGCCSP